MDEAIENLKKKGITNEFEIVKILMERAEQLSHDGEKKKEMVIESYIKLANQQSGDDSDRLKLIPIVPIDTIVLIIEAFIFISKTAVSINEKTGVWLKVKNFFKNLF